MWDRENQTQGIRHRGVLQAVDSLLGETDTLKKLSSIEVIILSWTKTSTIYHLYVESKKNDTDDLVYKMEMNSQISKTNLCVPQVLGCCVFIFISFYAYFDFFFDFFCDLLVIQKCVVQLLVEMQTSTITMENSVEIP